MATVNKFHDSVSCSLMIGMPDAVLKPKQLATIRLHMAGHFCLAILANEQQQTIFFIEWQQQKPIKASRKDTFNLAGRTKKCRTSGKQMRHTQASLTYQQSVAMLMQVLHQQIVCARPFCPPTHLRQKGLDNEY